MPQLVDPSLDREPTGAIGGDDGGDPSPTGIASLHKVDADNSDGTSDEDSHDDDDTEQRLF